MKNGSHKRIKLGLGIFLLAAGVLALWMGGQRSHTLRLVRMLPAMANASNVPIVFWGRAVDEAGQGIPSVRVTYRVQRVRIVGLGLMGVPGKATSRTTDADGYFRIKNETGVTLQIEGMSKYGYQLMRYQQTTFGYSRTPEVYVSKRSAPHVYVMKSNAMQKDVVSTSHRIKLPWDGKPLRIDISSGLPSSTGELVITASRTEPIGHFEWRFSLAVEGGGVLEAGQDAAPIAPKSGYLPVWECGFKPGAKPWWAARDANLFYTLGGKFGRLRLQIYAHRGPGDVSLHLDNFYNSAGGRITDNS